MKVISINVSLWVIFEIVLMCKVSDRVAYHFPAWHWSPLLPVETSRIQVFLGRCCSCLLLSGPLWRSCRLLWLLILQNIATCDEIWLVDKPILELTEGWSLLSRNLLDSVCMSCRSSNLRLGECNRISPRLLNSREVQLLLSFHRPWFKLRATPMLLAILAQFFILLDIEVRLLKVLIDVSTEHFFKVTVILIPFCPTLLSSLLAFAHLVYPLHAITTDGVCISSRTPVRVDGLPHLRATKQWICD